MKTKQQLSAIARKAVEKTLDNRINNLSGENKVYLKELINEYYEAKHDLDYNLDIQTIVFHEIGKTTLNSFVENGDRNYLTRDIKFYYLSDTGISLDIQALFASNTYHTEIHEQDFIDFIVSNPYGRFSFIKNQRVESIRSEIKTLIGFIATHKFIEKLYYKINTVQFEPTNVPF